MEWWHLQWLINTSPHPSAPYIPSGGGGGGGEGGGEGGAYVPHITHYLSNMCHTNQEPGFGVGERGTGEVL